MEQKICYVFGAGEYYHPLPTLPPDTFVIAVDGGFAHLQAQGVKADLVVGDFDSLDTPPQGVEVIALSKEKDDTDMLAALQGAFFRGYHMFHIYGGTGGRFDHTMANIQCLAYLSAIGAQGFLHDKSTIITTITHGQLQFPAEAAGYVSMFAHTDAATGVSEVGLKYTLDGATIRNIYPVGVSNEFTGEASSISVEDGVLLVTYPREVSATWVPLEDY